ncbi:MAG: alpha/beta hydrolase [Saonia sp.]
MTNKVVHTTFGKLEYSLLGEGQPILFVHGGHSNAHERLSHKGFDPDKYQLITPSRPGYGKTPLKQNETARKAADLLKGLLDEINIDKVVVYGVSAGGLTAIELAANHPERVQKLVLASAISKKWLTKDHKTYKTAQVLFNPNFQKLTWGAIRLLLRIAPVTTAKSFYQQFSKKPNPNIPISDTKELISALKFYDSGQGFINDLEQTPSDSSLEKVICSTFIVHSHYDNSVPVAHAEHAHQKIENSELLILKNDWGHLFWIGEDSDVAIRKIIAFIEK